MIVYNKRLLFITKDDCLYEKIIVYNKRLLSITKNDCL